MEIFDVKIKFYVKDGETFVRKKRREIRQSPILVRSIYVKRKNINEPWVGVKMKFENRKDELKAIFVRPEKVTFSIHSYTCHTAYEFYEFYLRNNNFLRYVLGNLSEEWFELDEDFMKLSEIEQGDIRLLKYMVYIFLLLSIGEGNCVKLK